MSKIFSDFFQLNNPKTVLITSHENADPDAICSAFAIDSLIHILYPEVDTIVSFDGISIISQKIINKFDLKLNLQNKFTNDVTIIVDANSIEQLGNLKNEINWKNPVLIIDHHVTHPNTRRITDFTIIDETAVATTELIFNIYQAFDISPSKKTAYLIFLGLLSDSRHLLLANNETLRIVNHLLELGVNYPNLIELLTVNMDLPERTARLKAAKRAKIHKVNGWLIAISHVSAYEASACRALINIGADVALVYGKKKNEIHISARATTEIAKETNLNLAKDVMEKIGPIMNGIGGGHDRAAGCEGKDNLESGLKMALKLLKEKLTNKS